MLWPSPSSTLFPYTTLFRSLLIDDRGLLPQEIESHVDLTGVAGNFWVGLALLHSLFMREHNAEVAGDAGQDRKSTRLNSSHVSTSYAVFCLKNKKRAVVRYV